MLSHKTVPERDKKIRPGEMLQATRYLCAAPYLDPVFAKMVIKNLLGSHRSVVPSPDIDLIPILRHCLRARKMQLIRDGLLSLLMITLFWIMHQPATSFVQILLLILGIMPRAPWQSRKLDVWTVIRIILVLALIALATWWTFESQWSGQSKRVAQSNLRATIWWSVLFLVVLFGVCYLYWHTLFKTLGKWLRPGSEPRGFGRLSARVKKRLAQIDSAQQGNLVLYGGEDPFLGAGRPPQASGRAWSLSIDLAREGSSLAWQGRAPIDPVELHKSVGERFGRLAETDLLPGEKTARIRVDDYVAGEGRFEWTSPLIDNESKIPFSMASSAAIEALIRRPQAGLRYYQRISIRDGSPEVSVQGAPVVQAVSQEATVSVFIHVAVEGDMLYLQFVPRVLAPVEDSYHIIDRLPNLGTRKFMVRAAITAAHTASNMPWAPFRFLWMLWVILRERRDLKAEASSSRDFVFADVGAKVSVRELGARPGPRTFIQKLDQTKYLQMAQRIVLDTILDFLDERGVDTSAYRRSVQVINNSGIMTVGDVHGSSVHNN